MLSEKKCSGWTCCNMASVQRIFIHSHKYARFTSNHFGGLYWMTTSNNYGNNVDFYRYLNLMLIWFNGFIRTFIASLCFES
jgi:hypothetical protein